MIGFNPLLTFLCENITPFDMQWHFMESHHACRSCVDYRLNCMRKPSGGRSLFFAERITINSTSIFGELEPPMDTHFFGRWHYICSKLNYLWKLKVIGKTFFLLLTPTFLFCYKAHANARYILHLLKLFPLHQPLSMLDPYIFFPLPPPLRFFLLQISRSETKIL